MKSLSKMFSIYKKIKTCITRMVKLKFSKSFRISMILFAIFVKNEYLISRNKKSKMKMFHFYKNYNYIRQFHPDLK